MIKSYELMWEIERLFDEEFFKDCDCVFHRECEKSETVFDEKTGKYLNVLKFMFIDATMNEDRKIDWDKDQRHLKITVEEVYKDEM